MFENFSEQVVNTDGADILVRLGGSGPPLLLLHGYPQTGAMWAKIAPDLASSFTVVVPDLRGYGRSSKPASADDHSPYAKRAMAADLAEVMTYLNFESFNLAGHDRGARVAHRLTLDFPNRVKKLAVLDIAPTLTMYERTDMAFATAYYHWFFLIQPFDLPERMIGADPEYYLEKKLGQWCKTEGTFSGPALAEYKRCFSDPRTIHASCEDYRAAATIDLEQDRADIKRKIACPLLVLWGAKGVVARTYDVLGVWRERADDVRGYALECGHFVPEEAPDGTLQAFRHFFEPA